ncbi:MAG: Gfo/Idh/MocA family oxidoreductase [Clostridia bacterium]|nr:Gfo/Idh/MocA family oxidoreductase [Clostridia bacterium]
MNRKLRIGVFGGYRGNSMIHVLYRHPDAELVAVCDKYQPILDKIKTESEEKGIQVALFNNFDDFIEYDMDAVILANYANEHAPFAIRCMKKGMHVLSEVLPCETMAQAVELIETVEETGKVYAYAENYCYMRHAFEMWRKYEEGAIGEVTYCEGEYIHDCSRIWPNITYGERDHWRNRMYAAFYCTHSIGPMLTVTGRRPVQVVGFETPIDPASAGLGAAMNAAIEMITLDNGAIARSVHGLLKREPGAVNYMFYGSKGMMESGRFKEETKKFNLYRESDKLCIGDWEKYDPEAQDAAELAQYYGGHGGGDLYATHYFIQKILGRPDGEKYSIDVYKAVDMGICGILAHRSLLNGNIPIKVPNLRNPEERDAWRNDHACCTPEVAGDSLLPRTALDNRRIKDEVYEYVKGLWLAEGKKEADYPYPGNPYEE